MVVAVAVTHYSKLPAGAAISPTSSIPVVRGSDAVVSRAMAPALGCLRRAAPMVARAAISGSEWLCCRNSYAQELSQSTWLFRAMLQYPHKPED